MTASTSALAAGLDRNGGGARVPAPARRGA